jgi:ketosteroid isomerase-like protein
MSQENVEVAQRFFEAWNARDADALAENAHRQAEILLPRNLLEGGSYTGPEGARRALADALETWEETRVIVEATREAAGDQVVVLGRTINRPPGGPRTETSAGYVIRVQDGQVAYLRPFMSHEDALEAAGLRG